MARILVADEHPMTRYAVRMLLQEAHHSVVGEARNGLEALSLAARLAPDLLIIDIDLSQVTGLDVITRLRARGLTLPILGYSTQDSEHYVARFLQVGASGFVSKHQEIDVLKEAIGVVLRGRSYFPSEMLGSVHHRGLQEKDAERVASLSNRELSVLSLLASGYGNQEIARELTISEKSVSTYRARMRTKLNLHSMLELIDFARRNRLAAPALEENLTAGGQGEAPMWRSMVESLPAAFYIRDLDARLLYANPAHLELYRCSLEEVLGTRTTDVDWYKPTDARNMLNFLLRQIAEESSFSKDIELTVHGQRRVLHHWGTPYRDADGRMLGMICCSTDITRRYEELAELRTRADSGELSAEQMTDLLRITSRELGVRLDMLDDTLGTLQGERLEDARAQLEVLRTQWAGLRSALDKTSEQPQGLPVRLDELADDVLQDLRKQASQRQLALKLEEMPATLRPVVVDRQRLRDVLYHLGFHVIETTRSGWVRLSVAVSPKQRRLGVRITLHGAPASGERVRAYSLAELTEEEAPSVRHTLSLNIARHLVSTIGGELHVSHLPEQGAVATIHLLLPVAESTE